MLNKTNAVRDRSKNMRVLFILSAALILIIVAATAIGAVYVPFGDTVRIILKNYGILKAPSVDDSQESIIFFVRFPRVLVAVLVGAALAASGCVMQGMFRNPMADPGIIGVSGGASLGAVTAIALGLTSGSVYVMPVFATAGALAAAWLIFLLASKGGKIPVLTLILSGIAVSTFLGAVTSLILTRVNEYQLREYLFWSVGSLSARRWEHVNLAAVPVALCVIILISFSRDLNILLLGEEEAQSVGLNPFAARKRLLFFTSVTTAMAVCVSGNISFVGLIVPHIMRLIVGPDNRILMPASALAGAVFLVGCDLAARVVFMPVEIGVGIVTSLVGAPYFLYLLNKARKEGAAL
ncbi:MAG: iron chelate uptake ABC transporter family permease subunit [Clostridiales bacterium]|jgi:iron complex transport system permease protein|nr:iron ABC transporter permease [Eubacteriales bacterium]MDH7566225.1 iron chelate uptake ABC transporter family permease subunit [Clostridiales bacterium]